MEVLSSLVTGSALLTGLKPSVTTDQARSRHHRPAELGDPLCAVLHECASWCVRMTG